MKLQIHICLCFLKGNDKLQFFLKGYKYKEEKMGIEGRLFECIFLYLTLESKVIFYIITNKIL